MNVPPAYGGVPIPAPVPGTVQAGTQDLGGLSFDISPSTAQVFIDGVFVGTVGQFTPTTAPLEIPAGRHHVGIQSPGFRPWSFDVDIIPGQVVAYYGTLER